MTNANADDGTALVTGAAWGIGHELSRRFAEAQYDLVLVDVDGDRMASVASDLADTYGVEVDTVRADLSDPRAPARVDDAVREADHTVDVLVNNAGVGVYGRVADVDVESLVDLVQINVTALTHLTGLFLPRMVERGAGKILNVASTSAFSPGPYNAAYNASKSYVVLFSEAIAEEVRDDGVTVTVLCPGHTDTRFFERMGVEESAEQQASATSPRTVAEAGYDALMRGETVAFDDRTEAVKASVAQALPRRVVRRIAKRNEESRGREPTARDGQGPSTSETSSQ